MSKNGQTIADYKDRVVLVRIAECGESQQEFADKIGIDMKRWNNYERGFPLPRDVAFLLWEKLDLSIEWLWFGSERSLTADWKRKLKAAQRDREKAVTPPTKKKSEGQRLRR